jgi:hypothetical protein
VWVALLNGTALKPSTFTLTLLMISDARSNAIKVLMRLSSLLQLFVRECRDDMGAERSICSVPTEFAIWSRLATIVALLRALKPKGRPLEEKNTRLPPTEGRACVGNTGSLLSREVPPSCRARADNEDELKGVVIVRDVKSCVFSGLQLYLFFKLNEKYQQQGLRNESIRKSIK